VTIPVILTHRGNQEYLKIAIRQARRRNGRVVLIGDESNRDFGADEHYLNSDYWEGAAEFAKVYRHMSHNPHDQELYCFQIYFVARDWARAHGVDRLFLMDSDVMLYCDVTEYEKTLGDYDLAINWCKRQEPYRWSACLHNSFWKVKTLEVMCNQLMDAYLGGWIPMLEQKWAWHQKNKIPGGVCDMTLLHFFRHLCKAINLSEVRDGSVWDDNINCAENYHEREYTTMFAMKTVILPVGGAQPALVLKETIEGEPHFVFANALHFQGQAKRLMGGYEG